MGNSVAIRELKNSLSRYLELVKNGETLTVTDRNRPVAQIIPISQSAQLDSDWQELIGQGALQIPLAALTDDYFVELLDTSDGAETLPDGALLRAVMSEREEAEW